MDRINHWCLLVLRLFTYTLEHGFVIFVPETYLPGWLTEGIWKGKKIKTIATLKMGLNTSTQHAEDRDGCSEHIVRNTSGNDNRAVGCYLPWQPNWPATMESCRQDYQNSTYRLEMGEKSPESYAAIVWVFALTPYDRSCCCARLKHQVQQFCSKFFSRISTCTEVECEISTAVPR